VRRAAHQFIERATSARTISPPSSGRAAAPDNAQDFTNNAPPAGRGSLHGQQARSATANKPDAYNNQRNIGSPARPRSQHRRTAPAYNARQALDTLRRAADFISGVRGAARLSSSSARVSTDVTDPFNNMSATDIMGQTRDAIAAATRANVNFYSDRSRG
jgi:hypothetical protein